LDDCALPRQSKDRQFLDYFPASQQAVAFNKLKASLRIRKDRSGD
jgi:hypothetical protein